MANSNKNILFFLVIGLVFLFALLVFSSGPSLLPYDNKTPYANYESFESIDLSSPSSSPSLSISPPGSTSQPPLNVNDQPSSNFVPLDDSPKTIQYGVANSFELIDKIGQTTKNGVDGVDGCVSSGLSNSGGPICLTPEMIQLMKSRGGYATGGI